MIWSNTCSMEVAVVVVANMSFEILKFIFQKVSNCLQTKTLFTWLDLMPEIQMFQNLKNVTTVYYMNERKLSLGQNGPSILGTRKFYHRENGPYKKVD